MIKRLINEKEQQILKDSKKFKDKTPENLSREELDELIVILSKKFGILK